MFFDAEDFAGRCELFTAHFAELFAAACGSAIGGGLAVGEAGDVDLNAMFGGESERAAESETFVVGMCGDA